jgi:hypothetical protein
VDLQGISAGYFIDRGGALGVMTGRRALLEYQTAGFPNTKGFCLNSAYGLPIQGSSVDFMPRGICSRVFGSREFPDTFKEKQDSHMQTEENHRSTSTGFKSSLFIADIQTSLIQSSQKACSAQIGDE